MLKSVDSWTLMARMRKLPVFPLPASVLMPGGHLPLFVFEPRYRKLVEDCLATDSLMGVGLLAEEDTGLGGRPPSIYSTIGVGQIEGRKELPDGREILVLKGLARARVVEELHNEDPYRAFHVRLMMDHRDQPKETLDVTARALRHAVTDLAQRLPVEARAGLSRLCRHTDDPGRLADTLGAALIIDHRLLQHLLEERRVSARLDFVTSFAVQLRAFLDRDSPAAAPN